MSLYNDEQSSGAHSPTNSGISAAANSSQMMATPMHLTQAAATQPRQLGALTLQPPPSPPPFPAVTASSAASEAGSSSASVAASPAPAPAAAPAASCTVPELTPTSAAIVFPMELGSAFTQVHRQQQQASSSGRTAGPAVPPARSSESQPQRATTAAPQAASDQRFEITPLPPQPTTSSNPTATQNSIETLQTLLQWSALQAGLSPAPPAAVAPAPAASSSGAAASSSSYFPAFNTAATPAAATTAPARPVAPVSQQPSASVAEASVLALADALAASMSRSQSRPSARSGVGAAAGAATAAPPFPAHQRNDRDRDITPPPAQPAGAGSSSSVEHQLAHLRGRFDSELASKDRAHSYAQADLLTAFQLDRSQADRKHAEELEALRTEVAQRESDLTAHQSLYANYSQRIQSELAALRGEVMQAQNELLAREEQAAVQSARIADLEAQIQDETRVRQAWEAELVQRSNGVLLAKQESFDADRAEWEAVQAQLSSQLHLQIESRASFEARLQASEAKRTELESRLVQAESNARNFETQARQTREQNLEMQREYAASQTAFQSVTADAQSLSAALTKLQREYLQLESLSNASISESSARIGAFKEEAARATAGYAAELAGHERALKEAAKCRADRLALHHAFLVFLRKRQMQTMLFRWIAATHARLSRNRLMQAVARARLRSIKVQAMHRWKLYRVASNAAKQLEETKQAATEQLQQRANHVAEAFHASRSRSRSREDSSARKSEVFQKWQHLAHRRKRQADGERSEEEESCCSDAQCPRNRDRSRSRRSRSRSRGRDGSPSASRSCSHSRSRPACTHKSAAAANDDAAALERQKKIELFHLLQSERTAWASMQARYEDQLLSCEQQGWQQSQQIESLQAAVASLSKQQELESKWKQFEREEKKAAQSSSAAPGVASSATNPGTAPRLSPRSAQAATVSSALKQRSPSPSHAPRSLAGVPEEPAHSGVEGQQRGLEEAPISSRAAQRSQSPSAAQVPRASPLRRGYAALAMAPSPAKSSSARHADRPLSPSSLRSHVSIPSSGLPPHHHLDVTGMLSEIEAAQEARLAKIELRELHTEINAEQARLAVLAQLRRERDQAEAAQARMGPSFLAQRMPTSPMLPLDGDRRILTDARAAQFEPAAAP